MKKVWIAVGIVVILAGLIGFNVWKKSAEGKITAEVTTLKEETITETVMTPGQLKLADQQTIYHSPEKGEVAEIFVKEGDDVKKGTPLIRYENKQLTLEQKQNELQLRSAYLQANDLRKQHEEIDKLLKDDKDNEQLKAEHDQIKLQQQQATIEIEQQQLQKESIQQQMNDLEIKSDIDGKVVEVNEQAAAGANQLEQQPVVRIGTIDKLIVEGVISEYDTLKIKEGQTVTLKSDAVPDKTWKGKVSLVADLPKELDNLGTEGSTSGVQYPVQITVEDKEMNLKPGFQMIVEITTDEHKANVLPLTAVKQDGDENYVYIVKNKKAVRQKVKVGSVANETIEITDGLSNKEKVIVDPPDKVKDGMEVTVK